MLTKLPIGLYICVSACAALLIFRENAHYMNGSVILFISDFVRDAASNHAARSMSLDLLLLGLSASVWMMQEAKRLQIRHAWIYIVAGILTAIAITFPLFLIHREFRMRQRERTS